MTHDHVALKKERSVLGRPRWYLWASMALLGASVVALRWRRSRRNLV